MYIQFGQGLATEIISNYGVPYNKLQYITLKQIMLKCQQHGLTNKLSRDRVEWHLTHTDLNVLGLSGLYI